MLQSNTRLRIRRFFFLSAFLYWILWGVPWLLQQFARLTHTPVFGVRYWALWNPITGWVGYAILGFPTPPVYTDAGSGDSPFFWTLVVVQFGTACLVAAIWSAFNPTARESPQLRRALATGLRLLFALVLIEYGAAKVIPTQFPPPRLEILVTPFGDLSPETLLWSFMGASPVYNFVAGAVEIAAGALLLFPQTAAIGALLGIGAITNVLIFNLGYDVPVKLVCIHLLLVGIWLFAPSALAVGRALVSSSPRSTRRTLATAVSVLILLVAGGLSLRENALGRRTYGDLAPRPPLYGMYRVLDISTPNPALAPAKFAVVIVPARGAAQVRLPDGRVVRYRLHVDTAAHKVAFRPNTGGAGSGGAPSDTLLYRETAVGIEIEGRVGATQLSAKLARIRSDTLPLNRQRFRWIH